MNFNYPQYSPFYKFLLLEDILFADNPALLHYGKCSIIGYLYSTDVLQSLAIPNVESEYQLPDGALSLKLYTEFHPRPFLHSTVQIYGEIRVIEKDRDIAVENFESPNSLIHRLRELQKSLEMQEGRARDPSGMNDKSMSQPVRIRLEKEINSFNERFMPIVFVDNIRRVSSAKELIYENLRYRQIREKVDHVMRNKR